MDNLHFLISWLSENYPNQNYVVSSIQRVFNDSDKIPKENILYFGFFSGSVVLSGNSGEFATIKDLHTRSFIFSSLGYNSSFSETFIGYEVVFERVLKTNADSGGVFTPEFNQTYN